MNRSLIAVAVVGATFALAACNAPDNNDRTTSIPRTVSAASTIQDPTAGYSAPPAQRELGPPPADANKAAPGTDPEAAFANRPNFKDPPDQKEKGDSAEEQHLAVKAQEAAAKAPDTASADEAKKAVKAEDASDSGQTSGGGARSGMLTKDEETKQLPKQGQVNNHSSTDLEKASGRPSN